jgi:hypothetical protein
MWELFLPHPVHLHDGIDMELKQFLQCVWGLRLKDTQSENTAIKSLLVIALVVLIDLDIIKMFYFDNIDK